MKQDAFLSALREQRQTLADAAQQVYDGWEPWEDDTYSGGICDEVAQAMTGVLFDHVPDIDIDEGGHDGDDHAWIIVTDTTTGRRYGVDIAPEVYEVGGGYNWKKLDNITILSNDVDIWEID